jgi:hypothetical protein
MRQWLPLPVRLRPRSARVVVGLPREGINMTLVDPKPLLPRHRIAELAQISLGVWQAVTNVPFLARKLLNLLGWAIREVSSRQI